MSAASEVGAAIEGAEPGAGVREPSQSRCAGLRNRRRSKRAPGAGDAAPPECEGSRRASDSDATAGASVDVAGPIDGRDGQAPAARKTARTSRAQQREVMAAYNAACQQPAASKLAPRDPGADAGPSRSWRSAYAYAGEMLRRRYQQSVGLLGLVPGLRRPSGRPPRLPRAGRQARESPAKAPRLGARTASPAP